MSQQLANQQQAADTQGVSSVAMIALEHVDAALAICDDDGLVLGGSPRARELLARSGMNADVLPAPLARDLWNVLMAHDGGEAVQWRPSDETDFLLSCTRYHIDEDDWLLIIGEISQKQCALAYRLHHQRLETLGRVAATAVHDLRAPLSSIVFGIDVLAQRAGELTANRTREIVKDVRSAAFCLRETIDCLLDFLRLGPPAPSEVSIRKVLSRTQSLLRPQLRMGPHELIVIVDNDVLVCGNLLTIEQIFVNLVVNSIEAAEGPTTVHVTTSVEHEHLRVLVEDSGPGIRADQRHLVFEPMFTTKPHGVGLGLTSAREAARSMGGDIQLVRWTGSTTFAVLLPMYTAEEDT